MRLIYFGLVTALAISTQAFAHGAVDKKNYSNSCAIIKNSDVNVRRDGVYAKVKATMENGKESTFFIKKTKKNEEILLMVDGERHYIQYSGDEIYNIKDKCL
ncbi:hypothetical protein [Kozakia baliensis]|uniref:hypothetical protein n=1 Tax=Kozakia baliensis TaxID=153496 RepID=UPI0004969C95|nr:hypothetical protein [Kozakia baliensis]